MNADLLIVGAGPAGLAAAELASSYDLSVLIVDEQFRPGGQIFRQPPNGFEVKKWLEDSIYKEGKSVLSSVSKNDKIQWRLGATILGVFSGEDNSSATDEISVVIDNGETVEELTTRYLLFATGCHDMATAFPGWNLPGVMATGGIQAFVKSQQIVPGERFLFVGTHPLQLIVADQIIQAGGDVVEVVFAQKFTQLFTVLKNPSTLYKFGGKFFFLAKSIFRLIKHGVRISFQQTVINAEGDKKLNAVNLASIDKNGIIQKGHTRNIQVDRLGTCFNFLASSELARQSGVNCQWDSKAGGWILECKEWMETNINNISVAGEITGVAGADAALEKGRLAALGFLLASGHVTEEKAKSLAEPIRKRLKSFNEFAKILHDLSYPGDLLEQLLSNNVNICKCECISVGDIKNTLSSNDFIGSGSAMKLISRSGMGLCQGRYCNYYITKILSEHTGRVEEDVKPFTAQFPAKPVSISKFIG